MEYAKPSIIKLELGIKLTEKFQNGETPFVDTLALLLASDEVALASVKNPSVMDPLKEQASRMDYEEGIEALAFFTGHVGAFSNRLQERMANVQTDPKGV